MLMDTTILKAYAKSSKRLFLLDYDGTLVDFAPTPTEATPTKTVLDTLRTLTADPANQVVIISGRKHEEMEMWLGALPVSLVAEHGLLVKQPGGVWQSTRPIDTSWKTKVRELMASYTYQLPGTLTEEKTAAIVWHWRNADDHDEAEGLAAELREKLTSFCAEHELKLIPGKDVLEVQQQGYSKGEAAKYWIAQDNWQFIVSIGDDTTDEDMFAALPDWAFTIKVGEGESVAVGRKNSPAEVLALLNTLAG